MFALSWHISWNKVLKVFSKTWWKVVQWAVLVPSCSTTQAGSSCHSLPKSGVSCCEHVLDTLCPVTPGGPRGHQSHMEALGNSVSLWLWPDFTSSKYLLHPLALSQKRVMRHTYEGWSLSKVTIWTTRLSRLFFYFFFFNSLRCHQWHSSVLLERLFQLQRCEFFQKIPSEPHLMLQQHLQVLWSHTCVL